MLSQHIQMTQWLFGNRQDCAQVLREGHKKSGTLCGFRILWASVKSRNSFLNEQHCGYAGRFV